MNEKEAREIFSRVRAERKAAVALKPQSDDSEVDEPEESWVEETLRILGGISPNSFERLAQRLLRESGLKLK